MCFGNWKYISERNTLDRPGRTCGWDPLVSWYGEQESCGGEPPRCCVEDNHRWSFWEFRWNNSSWGRPTARWSSRWSSRRSKLSCDSSAPWAYFQLGRWIYTYKCRYMGNCFFVFKAFANTNTSACLGSGQSWHRTELCRTASLSHRHSWHRMSRRTCKHHPHKLQQCHHRPTLKWESWRPQ